MANDLLYRGLHMMPEHETGANAFLIYNFEAVDLRTRKPEGWYACLMRSRGETLDTVLVDDVLVELGPFDTPQEAFTKGAFPTWVEKRT